MTDKCTSGDLPLFAAAGVEVEPAVAKRKRPRKVRPPSPAERAAAGRLEGARRILGLGLRDRIKNIYEAAHANVVPFPPHRDLKLVAKLIHKYLALVKNHGGDAYIIHARCNEEPIVARLVKYGLTLNEARAEVSRVQEAMAAMSLERQTERASMKAGGR